MTLRDEALAALERLDDDGMRPADAVTVDKIVVITWAREMLRANAAHIALTAQDRAAIIASLGTSSNASELCALMAEDDSEREKHLDHQRHKVELIRRLEAIGRD